MKASDILMALIAAGAVVGIGMYFTKGAKANPLSSSNRAPAASGVGSWLDDSRAWDATTNLPTPNFDVPDGV